MIFARFFFYKIQRKPSMTCYFRRGLLLKYQDWLGQNLIFPDLLLAMKISKSGHVSKNFIIDYYCSSSNTKESNNNNKGSINATSKDSVNK